MEVFGKAIEDYYRGVGKKQLISHSSLGSREVVPVSHFFRTFEQMPLLEQQALQLCRGRILDIGCGAGSHCLELQSRGLECTGLDSSEQALQVAANRGLRKTIHSKILDLKVGEFDTLLLLMNGIGLAGNLSELSGFLRHLGSLIPDQGQILLDSSDVIYLFEEDSDGGFWVPGDVSYYGEIQYYWEYEGVRGNSFPWLFVDFQTLAAEAEKAGLSAELITEGEHFDYLARLQKLK
ncbi:class I SAM-dependent methyltransferase [Robiginitalea sp. IMCC43444]|uniref:class I SAM-dependent methyltransferase n=1 Tax=Robiginitalea sp. IMCC43444 TaxID=3459121 RepID=UPI0040418DF4